MKKTKEACEVCGTEYERKKMERVSDYREEEFFQSCPKCAYNPDIARTLTAIVEGNAQFTISPRSRFI